ncbi:APC family permease [Intestinimonas massiliensis]|jgi:APA family basic amino acid/polyamine antiporter|uniref:APC family permease n=1 Tax=Intestinimonas massiliensis (ex Afouda et al. 2020) TaxID=1673721 RepID=A0ABS9MEI4_9FIRM|nr:APC family permease [Intestinimonas massiliensis (ex Afouda et al. 2020)]MCG4528704.1 APC family permease [Intestinimonas massiliensis (ex Afouda et al. 2020)]MCQ4806911.1 APC family permease [Intestinimonas massiliensis (ex Afouda et al. 2020)]
MGDGNKSISFFGLVAMGIGCMLGTSWLLLTGPWLEVAGGPLNLAVAFALCIVVELPFAFAYMEAIPMLPRQGGEVVYSSAAFGPGGGFAVGWAGVLMNSIVFCWVDLAAISLLDELFPALGRVGLLYTVGGHSVTLPNVLCQLALAGAIVYIQYRGADLCASLAKLATVVLLTMCLVGLAVCFSHFAPAVYAADGGLEFHFSGSASLLSMLVFSVAGWETVAKAAADATGPAARKAGAALITCLLIVTALLCLVPTAVAGNLPWRSAVDRTAPFADVLVSITGWPAVRLAFLATAFVGAVGVMNSTLYSSSRMLYGLARSKLVPGGFGRLHPRYGTPTRCVWFAAAFVLPAPFTGKLFFRPLIHVASLATIVMWVMTLAAVLRLRRTRSDLPRPVRMPGGRPMAAFGVLAALFLAGNILLPFSPGALTPLEYLLALGLTALGSGLYRLRDRSLTRQEREALILGDGRKEV